MKKTFLIAIVLAIASCSGKLDLDEAGSAAEWMTPLADNMPLAVLSIPGAHDAATFRHGITLGELRGKILVLSRNEYDGGPMGGYIYGWTSDGRLSAQKGVILREEKGFCATMWVQDYYHPEGPDDKWAQVKTMLIATARSGKPYPLVINHCSGYVGTLPDYRTNAMAINAQAASFIRSTGMCTGIVMMDFAGVERSRGKNVGGATLVRALVENN